MDSPIDIVFDMTPMVLHVDIVFYDDINGFSHRYVLRHQWSCQ